MQKFLNTTILKKTLLILFFVEFLSFLSHLYPGLNKISFFILILLTLFFSVKNLKYGVFIVFVELFISSKGYLFFYNYETGKFPIRIGLWATVMTVWFSIEIIQLYKNKKINLNAYKKQYIYYLLVLLFFVGFGIINAFINNNLKSNIFNDANAWLYFLFIFPVLRAINTHENKLFLLNIFIGSAIWTSIKTLFLFYLFTHNFSFLTVVYKWVRDTGVGEITKMDGSFYRIFFQTHIFIILAFFVTFSYAYKSFKNRKSSLVEYEFALGLSVLFLGVNILNFSRSNWVGLFIGFLLFFGICFWLSGIKKVFINILILFKVIFLSFFLFYLIVEFPIPSGGANALSIGEALKERTKQVSGEAGVSSRWALLPKLKEKIIEAPVLGQGFGTTVVYNSSDPRIRNEDNPEGIYETYAWEWGWLDVWIKLGFFGFLAYIIFLFKMLFKKLKFKELKQDFLNKNNLNQAVFIGIVVICAVNFFSPYLNHPLGIGYLIFSSLFIDFELA